MKTSLVKSTIYLTFASIMFMMSGYIVNIFLGRYLGPESYGIYGIIISLVTFINLTQTSGLPQAVSKYVASDIQSSEMIYSSGIILQVISTSIVSFIIFFCSNIIAQLLRDPSLTPYIQLSSFIFPFYGVFALLTGYYNGLHRFGTQSFIHILYSLTKIFAIIILAIFFHLFGVIVGFIISPCIVLLTRFHIPRGITTHFSYKKLLYFSLPLIGAAIFANLLQSIDLFFVKALMHSDRNTGYYTANQNIARIPFFALSALSTILFPSISRHISQNKHNETRALITKSLRFSLLLLAPSVMLIIATSDKALSFLFSSNYLAGAQSLAILVVGSGFFTIFTILTTIISSAGSPFKSALLAIAGVLLSSFLCMILIPRFGLNGAALATTFASGSMLIVAGILVYRKFHTLFSIRSFINSLLASLTIFFLIKIISFPVLILPVVYIVLFLIYVCILFVLREINQEDIRLFRSVIPGFILRKI